MTEKEYNVVRAIKDLEVQKSKCRVAERNYYEGIKEAQAKFERERIRLKEEWEQEKTKVEFEEAFLKRMETEKEQPYKTD